MADSSKMPNGSTSASSTAKSSSSASPATRTPIREVELAGPAARAKFAELFGRLSTDPDASDLSKPREHKFWSTQPVPQISASTTAALNSLGDDDSEPFEVKTVEDVAQDPYPLIDAFQWAQIDVTDDAELEEVYRLLNENYVEDTESMFRFDYSRDFLRWALLPPGWHASWHLGVRVKSNAKLVAFISAVPATLHVHRKDIPMVEINFLCVHKKLRSKRLAPVLIREITRRVNLLGVWQAVYTAGAILPRPVTASKYYHRALNPKKLIDVGFSRLQPRMTMARTIKLYSVKKEVSTPGLRLMREEDVPKAWAIFVKFVSQYEMYPAMTEEDFRHWYLPRKGVIYTYVVEEPETGRLTDLVSFYSLPSSVMHHSVHKVLNAAYAFCAAAVETPIVDLMRDALVMARQNDFDVFNALDVARHREFFKELKFHVGDGNLNFYLYNWKCRPITKEQNALILL